MTAVDTRQTLHARLAETFRGLIRDGAWVPGTVIPSEAELVEAYGASRGTVRVALKALRDEGLIVGGQGRQPQVRDTRPAQPFQTFLSFTEWARQIGREPGQRTIEVARRAVTGEAAVALRAEEGEAGVHVLRVRLLDGVPCMIERTVFALDAGQSLLTFDADSGSIFAHLKSLGVDLHRGQHVIDAVAATAEDADLLEVAAADPLLRVRRTTSDRHGRPLEFSDDRYLPTHTTFTVENTHDAQPALVRVEAPHQTGTAP